MKKCEWFVSSMFRGVGARVSNIMLVSLLVLSDLSFGGETPRESPNKPSVMRESPQHLIRAAHEPDELFRL